MPAARPPIYLARLTWPVLALVFVGTLGGTHPADVTRDLALAITAAIVLAINAPVVIWLLRRRTGANERTPWPIVGGVVVRLGAAACVLMFVGGISHGAPPDRRHDAHRRCHAVIADGTDAAPSCATLHMCANEATLSAEEQTRLAAMIAATPGCEPP